MDFTPVRSFMEAVTSSFDMRVLRQFEQEEESDMDEWSRGSIPQQDLVFEEDFADFDGLPPNAFYMGEEQKQVSLSEIYYDTNQNSQRGTSFSQNAAYRNAHLQRQTDDCHPRYFQDSQDIAMIASHRRTRMEQDLSTVDNGRRRNTVEEGVVLGSQLSVNSNEAGQLDEQVSWDMTEPGQQDPKSTSVRSSICSEEGLRGMTMLHVTTTPVVEKPRTRTKEPHFRVCGHGKLWTCVALVAAWSATILSALSRHGIDFVRLEHPLEIAPIYNGVHELGMIRMELCYNETVAGLSGCEIINLTAEDIDDNMFEVARLLLTLASVCGVFFTIAMSTAVCWESINLKPIGVGYLATYFFQSFSMLFFDTQLCEINKCRVGMGGILCIVASFGWLTACIATAKMDAFKIKAARKRRRIRRQMRAMKRALKKKNSTASKASTTSTGSSNRSDTMVVDDIEMLGEPTMVDLSTIPREWTHDDATYEC